MARVKRLPDLGSWTAHVQSPFLRTQGRNSDEAVSQDNHPHPVGRTRHRPYPVPVHHRTCRQPSTREAGRRPCSRRHLTSACRASEPLVPRHPRRQRAPAATAACCTLGPQYLSCERLVPENTTCIWELKPRCRTGTLCSPAAADSSRSIRTPPRDRRPRTVPTWLRTGRRHSTFLLGSLTSTTVATQSNLRRPRPDDPPPTRTGQWTAPAAGRAVRRERRASLTTTGFLRRDRYEEPPPSSDQHLTNAATRLSVPSRVTAGLSRTAAGQGLATCTSASSVPGGVRRPV